MDILRKFRKLSETVEILPIKTLKKYLKIIHSIPYTHENDLTQNRYSCLRAH